MLGRIVGVQLEPAHRHRTELVADHITVIVLAGPPRIPLLRHRGRPAVRADQRDDRLPTLQPIRVVQVHAATLAVLVDPHLRAAIEDRRVERVHVRHHVAGLLETRTHHTLRIRPHQHERVTGLPRLALHIAEQAGQALGLAVLVITSGTPRVHIDRVGEAGHGGWAEILADRHHRALQHLRGVLAGPVGGHELQLVAARVVVLVGAVHGLTVGPFGDSGGHMLDQGASFSRSCRSRFRCVGWRVCRLPASWRRRGLVIGRRGLACRPWIRS